MTDAKPFLAVPDFLKPAARAPDILVERHQGRRMMCYGRNIAGEARGFIGLSGDFTADQLEQMAAMIRANSP